MRRPGNVELANGFIWLTVLAATVIVLRGSASLWTMVMVVLVGGTTSAMLFAEGLRRPR